MRGKVKTRKQKTRLTDVLDIGKDIEILSVFEWDRDVAEEELGRPVESHEIELGFEVLVSVHGVEGIITLHPYPDGSPGFTRPADADYIGQWLESLES